MTSIAVTGHRPERLGYSELDSKISKEWRNLIENLKIILLKAGVTDAYCGMANGCDIAYGLAIYELKYKEGYSIKLHCVLPCKNYNSENYWYKILKDAADEWVELSDEFYKGCDNVRDQYMIDHSDKLVAIWDDNKSGGVWSTIKKAQRKGIEVIYYPKEEL